MRKNNQFVSIIILTYNSERFVKACLESVFKQDYKEFEVILVDNGSKDNSVNISKKYFDKEISSNKLKLILNDKNSGFAGGNNIGVKNISNHTDLICLLNIDTKVNQDWLSGLVKLINSDAKLGVVGSLLVEPNGEKSIKEVFDSGITGTLNLFGDFVKVKLFEGEKKTGVINYFFIGGYSLLYRKKIIDFPFEDVYFAYSEDVYLGWLFRLKGYLVKEDHHIFGFHYHGSSKRKDSKLSDVCIFNGTKNNWINFFAFYEWKNIFKLFPVYFMVQIAHIIYEPYKLKYKLKAMFWVITNFGKIMRIRKKVQVQRKVSDNEITKYMSSNIIDEFITKNKLILTTNKLSKVYCDVMGIKYRE